MQCAKRVSGTPVAARGTFGVRTALSLLTAAALALCAAATIAPSAASAASAAAQQAAAAPDLAPLVNPFIGTENEGNTFPGATVPFGMVQFSPDTGHSTGYDYSQSSIRGFSLMHLSGVGCGLGGMLPVLPTTGDITSTDDGQYALGFDHASEQAHPGSYRVDLASPSGAITAELSATTHTGAQRYTFPATTKANVMIDAGQALSNVARSSVSIIDDQTVQSAITVHGFCQDTKPFTVYTTTHFDRPFTASGTWTGDTVTAGSSSADSTDRTGAYVRFDTTTNRVVEATTSLSYVDAAGATKNLDAESAPFDDVVAAASSTWEQRLASVKVTSSDQTQLTTFASALYRSFLAPNTGTDVDGRYEGWDGAAHTATGFTYYQNFSLWDTFRTQEQMLALLAPRQASDMACSLVKEGEQGGWAPRWSYGPVETNIMTGDPITPFLVSAWSEGLLAGHEAEAYTVLRQNADGVPPAGSPSNGRAGNTTYIADGYVPYDAAATGKPGDFDLQHGGSATLEYALADAALSTMAKGLGHDADAARYAARGENYRAVFDTSTGAFRARTSNGLFVSETDPANAPGFHEGTAVQYEWLVPQDMSSLVGLFGGRAAASAKLDAFFAYPQVVANPADTARNVWVNGAYSYYNQDKYNPNNEPDLDAPYAYLWTGQPWKTTDVVRAALTLFSDGPDGVTGNDDLGEMSSWAVMSSLGIYPIVPGSDVWGLSTPVFSSVDITLDKDYYPRGSLHIGASGVSPAAHYTQSVTAGGTAIDRAYLTGKELTSAGDIDFTVGSAASSWATGTDAVPASMVTDTPAAHRLTVAGGSGGSVSVAAGSTATVPLTVLAQGDGTITGTLSATSAGSVAIGAADTKWKAVANGGSVETTVNVPLTVPAGTAAGTYPVHLTVADSLGDSDDVDVDVVVPQESWLQGSFTNTGIGDRGQNNADIDGQRSYFLRDELAAAGLSQGQQLTVPGTKLQYVLAPVAPGEPDNLVADGQTTAVHAALGTAHSIALVGAGTHGTQSESITLRYTDGTSTTVPVVLADWCSSSPEPGDIALPATPDRGTNDSTQSLACRMSATNPITLADGKSLQSITWPVASGMHVFAIASDTQPSAVPSARGADIDGTVAVGETVHASDPSWSVDGASTSYQWSLDGVDIDGATAASYTIGATDLDKHLAVTLTGRAAGYLPGSSTSPAQTVAAGRFTVTAKPVVTGTAKVGEALSASGGAYSVDDVTIAYAWQADGVPIDGATKSTFRIGSAQRGARIAVVVTASKAGYRDVTTSSAPTDAVVGDGTGTPGTTTSPSGAASATATSGDPAGSRHSGTGLLAFTGTPEQLGLLTLLALIVLGLGLGLTALTRTRTRRQR